MKKVSIITVNGGIDLGTVDDKGRIVKRAGMWVPKGLEKMLTEGIAEIVEDDGKMYMEEVRGLALPLMYKCNK